MAGAKAQQPPKERKKKFGSTMYVVTPYFHEQGSTAVDKVRCLIDTNTKGTRACRNG